MELNQQKTILGCIIGKPNAGKSSLLNAIIGQKLSIVTPKVQTTRSIITGVFTFADTQIILFDTPGIFEPKGQFERAMVRCAWSSLRGADIIMLIIDSLKPIDDSILEILEKLKSIKIHPVFLLNKIDINSPNAEKNAQYLSQTFPSSRVLKISALTGKGVDQLLEFMRSNAKITPWLYEKDDLTNLPMRFLTSEITREQLFLNLHEELPYNLTVQTEAWETRADKSVKISQVIVVSKENYKMMILGNKGLKIKEIGVKARIEMEKLLECRVHLFLFIKVRPEWDTTAEFYHYMGLKFQK